MQLRRLTGIVVSIVLIGVILLVFTDPWSTLRKENRNLLLQDRDQIDRIILSDRYDSTVLVRKGEQWFISGEEAVNPVALENLLYAAERWQISSILSDLRGWDNGEVRKVGLYHGNRTVLKYDMKPMGNRVAVRPSGSDRAYFMTLPGYADLGIYRIFSSASNHYRDHLLIDLLPSEISYIEVERKGEEPFGFAMDQEGEITCRLPRLDSTLASRVLDDLSIRLLFSYFTAIRYEEIAGGTRNDPIPGSVEERWLARLYIESRLGEKHTLNVYSIPGEDGHGSHMFRAHVLHNDDTRPLVVNYIYLDVLMRGLTHYLAGE